eukprot:3320210-Alexandrium_andersonii.AAC.1
MGAKALGQNPPLSYVPTAWRAMLREGACLALCKLEQLSAARLGTAERRALAHGPPCAYGIRS